MLLQKPPLSLKDRLRRSCHLKRFFECWMADADFRQQFEADPQTATAARGLSVDPEEFRQVWEWFAASSPACAVRNELNVTPDAPAALREFRALKNAERAYQDELRERATPTTRRWQAWRSRQIARMSSQLAPSLLQVLLHPPFACELSRGCSVGCWFCGVGALKLGDHFTYTPENAVLWTKLLHVLRKFAGGASGGQGFLYWATDPLDNPDYEKFASDFRKVFARYPDLTTSQPVKHLDRVRRLIELSNIRDDFYIRFSVLTLRQLNALHAEFSAEDLATVSLIPRNKGSLAPIALVGAARKPQLSQRAETGQDETIACVSGFLLNMVERSIQLVTPCLASERWPLGYIVYEQAFFRDETDLERTIGRMIATHMPDDIPADRPLRFRSDLKYSPRPNGFQLASPHAALAFRNNPLLDELGDVISQGTMCLNDVVHYFREEFSVDEDISRNWIKLLFDNGVLDEEPLRLEAAL
jgi:radical SAM family RiPP maturation amino acid epimerase